MKTPAMQPISIVVPTLNEAENLPLLLERIYASLHSARIPFEIIVVDDHSNDATAAIAQAAPARYHVRLLRKQGKVGKAYSLKEGFAAARHDIICMIDADLQYPPEAISRMYHKMQYCNADIVITNRVEQQTSRLRKFVSAGFHFVFTRILFGINYDTQSGLKLFKKQVLDGLQIAASPWTFDLEFVVRSLEKKYVILSEDIPFAERHAGVPKINIVSASLEVAWQSIKLRRNVAKKRVKLQYRNLQPLQQSFNWIAALIIGVFVFGAISQHTVQAASFPTLQDIIQSLTPRSNEKRDETPKQQPTATTTPTEPTATPVTTTADTTPAITTTAATTSTAAPAATSSPSKTSSTGSSSSSSAANTTNTPVTSTTPQNSGSDSKNSYYTPSKLSQERTNTWLTLAGRVLVIGLAIVVVGLLLLGIRRMLRQFEQSSRRSSHHYRQTLSDHSR